MGQKDDRMVYDNELDGLYEEDASSRDSEDGFGLKESTKNAWGYMLSNKLYDEKDDQSKILEPFKPLVTKTTASEEKIDQV